MSQPSLSSTASFSEASFAFPASTSTDSFQAPPASTYSSSSVSTSASSSANSTASKVLALLDCAARTESEYVDNLYLLFSYLSSNNPLYPVVQHLIDLPDRPFLEYVATLVRTPQNLTNHSFNQLKQWVS